MHQKEFTVGGAIVSLQYLSWVFTNLFVIFVPNIRDIFGFIGKFMEVSQLIEISEVSVKEIAGDSLNC